MSREYTTVTTSLPKSHNKLANQGIDDMDYVEELGLDPALAYTPKINDAIYEAVARQNEEYYIRQGKTPAEARAMARNNMNTAKG